MRRFEFKLATQADDGELRSLLAATPMDGNISIAFARQPSYFAAAEVDGRMVQVGVARDGDSGRIIGMGSRAISPKRVNGRPTAVGYLSGLRLMREYRGQAGLLARGYRFLHKLHTDGAAPYYLTTIAADNDAAAEVLTSGRAGLPVYSPWGNFRTVSISTVRAVNYDKSVDSAVRVRQARRTDRSAIVKFLNEQGSSRQFFPVYEEQDLFSGKGLLKDLAVEDVLLAIRNGHIVGTLGCWDQRGFRQIVVDSYHGWLLPMRRLYNAWATFSYQPTLPVAGSVLGARLAAIPVVRDDDRNVFQQLLEAAIRLMANIRERMLLIGLHENDPLLPVVRKYPGREYLTRLYLVYWLDDVPNLAQLTQRVPYLELGSL